jgi:hypothetical protein
MVRIYCANPGGAVSANGAPVFLLSDECFSLERDNDPEGWLHQTKMTPTTVPYMCGCIEEFMYATASYAWCVRTNFVYILTHVYITYVCVFLVLFLRIL